MNYEMKELQLEIKIFRENLEWELKSARSLEEECLQEWMRDGDDLKKIMVNMYRERQATLKNVLARMECFAPATQ